MNLLGLSLDLSNLESSVGRFEKDLVSMKTEESVGSVLSSDFRVEKDGCSSGTLSERRATENQLKFFGREEEV